MAALLLIAAILLGLFIIPLGLPGLWVMGAGVLLYDLLVPGGAIGTWTVVIVAILALVGEGLEWVMGGRYARKFGGSRRAEWGAILGGIAGALVGVPVFLIGGMIGAFAGAFIGAWLAEMTRRSEVRAATRVATGALLGRIAGVVVKIGIGCVILAWTLFALWRGA